MDLQEEKELLKRIYLLSMLNEGIDKKEYDKLGSEERLRVELRGDKYFLRDYERKKIKVGLTGGVFDVLHLGHVFTLQKAKERCDLLVVVIASDALALKTKRKLLHTQTYRQRMMQAIKYVDYVLLGGEDRMNALEMISPDLVIFGYDQKPFLHEGKYKIMQIRESMNDDIYKSSRIIKELGY